MTSKQLATCCPSTQSLGFVVAMRAKLIEADLPPRFEWVIVSRWGTAGQHLSIGWTWQPALPGEAPINLTPSKTSLAVRPVEATAEAPATFNLEPALPSEITVAGEFAPGEGYVRLFGSGAKLRVRLKGQCLSCPVRTTWQIDAAREAWLGEFIETQADFVR